MEEIVLPQVVDILLLELASQRFDKLGMLFQQVTVTPRMHGTLVHRYLVPNTIVPIYDFHKYC